MLFTNCNVQQENKLRFLGKEEASDVLIHSPAVADAFGGDGAALPGGRREGCEGQC